MDHDRADKPGGDENLQAYMDGVAHIFSGSTPDKHFPNQDTAMARIRGDIDSGLGRGREGLVQFGRHLHSLEDVGTRENPGPHSRGTKHMAPDLIAAGVLASGISAIIIGNLISQNIDYSWRGVGLVALWVLGITLAVVGLFAIVFGFAAIGQGHGTFITERGTRRGHGGESSWRSHVADQAYQDPVANTALFNEVFGLMKEAAIARYGGRRDTDEAGAAAAIRGLVEADTMEKIDAYMHAPVRMPDGTMAPSYADILSTRPSGAWTPRDMDITVEDDATKYSDFYDRSRGAH
jgi:hypothetical protein